MSDTPRTDDDLWSFPGPMKVAGGFKVYVRAQTSRELERELNAALDRIKRLEDWKQSALEVEREWNANSIATMLGGKLGESQREVIQREVPKLLARIKLLEDCVETAWGVIANVDSGSWGEQRADWREAAIRWRDDQFHPAFGLTKPKAKEAKP